MQADPSVPATLTLVTQLVPGQSWLYPDGRWTGPTRYVQRFTDVKLLCTGSAPTHQVFANDFSTAVANLNTIMGQLGDSRNERATILSGPTNNIRMRHALFMVGLTCSLAPFLTPSCIRNTRMLIQWILPVSYMESYP